MDRGADVAGVDDLPLGDLRAHHVQPLGVVHDFLRDEQLAVHQPAELARIFLTLSRSFAERSR